MRTEFTTPQLPPVNYHPSTSEVLDFYWKSWQDERTMGEIMKPVIDGLAATRSVRPARMYGEQRLIGF